MMLYGHERDARASGGDLSNANIVDLKQLQWLFDAGKNPPDFITNMKKAIRNLDNNEINPQTLTKFGVNNADELKSKILTNFDTIFKLK